MAQQKKHTINIKVHVLVPDAFVMSASSHGGLSHVEKGSEVLQTLATQQSRLHMNIRRQCC